MFLDDNLEELKRASSVVPIYVRDGKPVPPPDFQQGCYTCIAAGRAVLSPGTNVRTAFFTIYSDGNDEDADEEITMLGIVFRPRDQAMIDWQEGLRDADRQTWQAMSQGITEAHFDGTTVLNRAIPGRIWAVDVGDPQHGAFNYDRATRTLPRFEDITEIYGTIVDTRRIAESGIYVSPNRGVDMLHRFARMDAERLVDTHRFYSRDMFRRAYAFYGIEERQGVGRLLSQPKKRTPAKKLVNAGRVYVDDAAEPTFRTVARAR